ncbi:MAG: hypothetical protein HY941_13115 [Gammaproteobacteria bacterium]|nr:hypothetical protein [Gammaproteobacteria bacterium]
MSIINFRPDDGGVQSLKQENATSPANGELRGLTASVRIQPVDEQPRTPPQAPLLPVTYSGPERRQGERRLDKQRVILDTRDNRERRRQAQDQPTTEDVPKVGIDVFG